MRKLLYIDAVAILLLLVGRLCLSGPIVFDSESTFDTGLGNSLYYLDRAKWNWAEKEHKVDEDIPSMTELLPYMGDQKVLIDKFTVMGVRYTITPFGEDHNQSDTATLTKDIRFQTGFSRFYPAGTKVTFAGAQWTTPPGSTIYRFFQHNLVIFEPLWVLTFAIGNAAFLFIWIRNRAIRAKAAAEVETTGSRREGGVEPPRPGL